MAPAPAGAVAPPPAGMTNPWWAISRVSVATLGESTENDGPCHRTGITPMRPHRATSRPALDPAGVPLSAGTAAGRIGARPAPPALSLTGLPSRRPRTVERQGPGRVEGPAARVRPAGPSPSTAQTGARGLAKAGLRAR